MIAIKTILFFLAIVFSFVLIEDAIEKSIIHSKKHLTDLHEEYTRGLLSTFNSTLLAMTIVFWTALYLVNQLS